MKNTIILLCIILALAVAIPWGSPVRAGNDDYEIEFKGKVGEELNKIDADQLLDKISTLLQDYKFTDDDVLELTDATEAFIKTVSDYSKKLKASESGKDVVAPHDELRDYCNRLEKFLKKYSVTVDDTLKVGRAVTFVAMSIKDIKESPGTSPADDEEKEKAIASKEDVDGVFMLLMDFSKKHHMMASDFMPVIYRLCDIGLTLMQNRVDMKKIKEAGGRWRKRLYDLGVSKEQADGLYDSLVAFIYKYKISLREILKLNKEINKLLKSSREQQKKS